MAAAFTCTLLFWAGLKRSVQSSTDAETQAAAAQQIREQEANVR
jgi:hypothetical protein